MSDTALVLFCLVLHLLVCAALWFWQRRGQERYACIAFVQCLVPLWGPLCMLLLHTKAAHGKEPFRPEAEGSISNGLLPTAYPAAQEAAAEVVPLEEALLVNSPRQRRQLILSVLEEDPMQYYAFLQQARMNDDSEVVHYAATAMAQISKQSDLRLQQLEQRCAAAPQDAGTRREAIRYLQQVLDAGLLQGRAAELRRRQLADLLEQVLRENPEYASGCQLARIQLELREDAAAKQTLAALTDRWPQQETAWLLLLRCAVQQKDGTAVQQVLDTIRQQGVWLSAEGRQTIQFWQQNDGGGKADDAAGF